MNVELHFKGPYSWLPTDLPSVMEKDATTTKSGIYLWTAGTPDGELVWYIGQTGRRFRARFSEHLAQFLSGRYSILEPQAFGRGEMIKVWSPAGRSATDRWPEDYIPRMQELAPTLIQFLGVLHIMLAPLDADPATRKRIEIALGDHLAGEPEPVGTFQAPRYQMTPASGDPILINLRSEVPIRGLPTRLSA